MQPKYPEYYPQFFTATILEWKHLLKPVKYKQVVVESLAYLVRNSKTTIFGFVVMDNHIHLIWQARPGYKPTAIQHSFLKFTAQQIRFDLQKKHPAVLNRFKVNAKDREYQFWERNALGVEIHNEAVLEQKLMYMHNNPVRAGLNPVPENYKYSSARFYETGIDDFGFITHYKG